MHPVLGKIKFNAFSAEASILGPERRVTYHPGGDGESSELAIHGLELADALHVLDVLNGGLLVGKDAENTPAAKPNGAKAAEPKPDPKPEAKAAPPPAKVAAPKKEPPKPAPEPDDDLDDDVELADGPVGLDMKALSSMDKIRPVLEHMQSAGYDTVGKVVKLSSEIREKVPALVHMHAKGDFERRVERAYEIVMGPAKTEASVH